jgi:hypothetical protein
MKGLAFLPLVLLLSSCGGGPKKSLEELKKDLSIYDEYSVILQDMDIEGVFSKTYHHKYKVVHSDQKDSAGEFSYQSFTTAWVPVALSFYQKHEGDLGMTLLSKNAEGQVQETVHPAGYQYIGNARYGEWRTDSSGNRFWEFYGKFAFFNSMFHLFSPVRYRDYDYWRTDYYSRGRPYYGRNNEYGTTGSYTKKTNPTFFDRKVQREQAKKSRFADKVNSRQGRSSMSSTRSRSSRSGK